MNVGETRNARSHLASILKEHFNAVNLWRSGDSQDFQARPSAPALRESIAYARGALDLGLKMGAISLPEKEAALLVVSGYPRPQYLDEWWKETAVFLCTTGL